MDLQPLYSIAAKDQSLRHSVMTTVATLASDALLWPQLRTMLTAMNGGYAEAFRSLYTRLSGEERETLRLVRENTYNSDSPRQQLYQHWGIGMVVAPDETLPKFVFAWLDWWQASASVKPLPEAFGAFAVAHPVIEIAFFGQLPHDAEVFTAFLLETEQYRKHWEAVLPPYTARLDLIAQGTRQALRQWHALQDHLLLFITTNMEKERLWNKRST